MSVHAVSWAFRQKVGDAGAKLVLIKLADQANDRGECFPSQRTLAEECEMSRRTVQRKLELLYELGLVSAEQRTRSTGGSTSLLYTVGPVRQIDAPPGVTGDVPPAPLVSHHEPPDEPSSPADAGEGAAVAPPARDDLWDLLEEKFGRVAAKTNAHARRNKAVADLRRLEATPDEVRYAIDAWSRRFVGATLTDIALATHFPQLRPSPDSTPAEAPMKIDPSVQLEVAASALRFRLKQGVCGECGVGGGNHVDGCLEARETPRRAYRRFVEEHAADPVFPLDEIAAVVASWTDLDDVDRQELLELAERIRERRDDEQEAA